MANYGLAKPIIAKLDAETGAYTEGFQCGKAVSTDITPNYNEGSLYGDNELQEYVKEFKDADVNLTVTTMPIASATVMFGHAVDEATQNVIFSGNDSANFVGYGFYATEIINNVKSYPAVVLPKVKFTESAESYTTKGESIEFKTPALAGKAYTDINGNWKYKQLFDTEAEAIEWIQTKLGITP